PLCDSTLEHVQMLREHDARLHHVEAVDPPDIHSVETSCQESRLLLIIPFETNAVARPDHALQQGDGVARFHQLMFRQGSSGVNSRVTRIARLPPGPQVVLSLAHAAPPAQSARPRL